MLYADNARVVSGFAVRWSDRFSEKIFGRLFHVDNLCSVISRGQLRLNWVLNFRDEDDHIDAKFLDSHSTTTNERIGTNSAFRQTEQLLHISNRRGKPFGQTEQLLLFSNRRVSRVREPIRKSHCAILQIEYDPGPIISLTYTGPTIIRPGTDFHHVWGHGVSHTVSPGTVPGGTPPGGTPPGGTPPGGGP